ncbi:MAG: hypothetical protein AAF549_00720 [Pseudomonadota bacterium]
MKLVLFIAVLFFSKSAFAQNKTAICNLLDQQSDVVSAEYVAGVDAYGRSVVPADGKISNFEKPIRVPLQINLAEQLRGMNIEGLDLDADFGFIEITQEGRVSFEDTDITEVTYDWCGTKPPQMEEGNLEEPIAEKPQIIEPVEEIVEQQEIPTQEETVVQENEEIITGSDYRDYND